MGAESADTDPGHQKECAEGGFFSSVTRSKLRQPGRVHFVRGVGVSGTVHHCFEVQEAGGGRCGDLGTDGEAGAAGT